MLKLASLDMSLQDVESQLLKDTAPLSLQPGGCDMELNPNASVASESAEVAEGRVVDTSLSVDAEMASSQSEAPLVQASVNVAWGYEMDSKGMLVEQKNPMVFEFDDETFEFHTDYLNEMLYIDSSWSSMTIIFKPDPGQVSDGAAFNRDDAQDWLKGQVKKGRVRLHPDCSLAFLPGKKGTKRNYYCGEEVFGNERGYDGLDDGEVMGWTCTRQQQGSNCRLRDALHTFP